MHCVMTGSSGYVGSRLRDALRAENFTVTELVRDIKKVPGAVQYELGGKVPVEAFQGADLFVHCSYDMKAVAWDEIYKKNVQGSIQLLEAAHAAGIKKIVLISTISAFAGARSLYGKAKLEIEQAAARLGAFIIRPGLVYGEKPGGMFGTLRGAATKLPIVPVIGGSSPLYLCHEGDLAQLLLKIARTESVPRGVPLIAANSQPLPFRAILDELAREGGKRPLFVPVPWQFAWLGLKALELIGLKPPVKSDSLLSLMNPDPAPDFSPLHAAQANFRTFR